MEDLKQIKHQIKILFEQNNIPCDEVDKLLCEVLNIDYSRLFLLDKITKKQHRQICSAVKKRLKHVPLTKIFKRAYFFGLPFKVNKHVLSPRQETELVVEQVLKVANINDNILDICTGSGAIAISVSVNGQFNVDAVDISSKALKVAKQNAKLNSAKVNFFKSDMFKKVSKKYDIIVSNPPYITSKTVETLPLEVLQHDPKISLDGGEDGLKFYKILANQSPYFLKPEGYLIMEIGYDQRESLENLLKSNNFDTICLKDYSLNDRVIIGRLKKV